MLFLLIAAPSARWSRKLFVGIGIALSVLSIVFLEDWPAVIEKGLAQGAFIAAFFIALASLRNPASVSPAIARCGTFLATQRPGKRYAALTIGGHLFALILNYGAITLLGGLTESIAGREPNAEVREIRNRRMLLAIQRGFCASLCWSPLAFATAITTSLVAGSSWSGLAPFALFIAAVMTFIGWLLDTLYKPKLTGPAPSRQAPVGSLRDLAPLLLLLVILFVGVGTLEILTGLRIIAVVMLFVPLISIAWIAIESEYAGETLTRLKRLAFVEFPSYRSEILLLVMAGFIGAVGGALLQPVMAGQALDPSTLPVWLVLVAPIWIIPLLGQLGMNPILSVSMLLPLLPPAAALGIDPNVLVVAITSGWSLAGATSPFTATTLLIGRLGHTSAVRVGLVWNRTFTLITAAVMSAIILVFAQL
nr:hypothetical protein [Jiella sp. LLJ827]